MLKKIYNTSIYCISGLDILNCFDYITISNLTLILTSIFLIDIIISLSKHKKLSLELVLDIIILCTILLDFGFIRLLKQFKHFKLLKKIYPLINKTINIFNMIKDTKNKNYIRHRYTFIENVKNNLKQAFKYN